MKPSLAFTIIVAFLSFLLPASAYSGITDINGESRDELAKLGITIKTWANDEGLDLPAVSWMEISYDWKRMGEDRHVEMTLYSSAANGQQPISATRTEHRKGQTDPMKLLFAVPRENIGNCHICILFPSDPARDREDIQTHGFGLGDGAKGFSLDVWRIAQLLAGDVAKENEGKAGETRQPTAKEKPDKSPA